MVSTDVENLFTNVPLSETQSIIYNHFYNQSDTFINVTHDVFKKLLDLSAKSYFFFIGTHKNIS